VSTIDRIAIRRVAVERAAAISEQSFDAVLAKLAAAVGHPDMSAFARDVAAAGTSADLERIVEAATGPAGLMERVGGTPPPASPSKRAPLITAAVPKTGAYRLSVRAPDRPAIPRPRRASGHLAGPGSCEQSDGGQSIAGMIVGEKNRCLMVSAVDARIAGLSRWTLRAGRDNFRDNLAFSSIPVTRSLSYT
jgi:hypothetical protein